MRLLNADDLAAALPLPQAIEAVAPAFIDISRAQSRVAERQSLPVDHGTGLLMGAAGDGLGIAAKLVSVMPGNAGHGLPGTIGLLALNDDITGAPLALMDGTAFTARRTAAVAACATDLLARRDARRALLFGCGTQAATQLLALDAIRDLQRIEVCAREPARAEAFVDAHAAAVRAALCPCTDPVTALESADIVIAATNSETPLFTADLLSAGSHVTGIGSFRPGMCEIDPTLAVLSKVFVESRLTAAVEAGELIEAIENGLTDPGQWAEVGEVMDGNAPGRENDDDITFFKSVGHAVFDLHLARLACDLAVERGLGTEWAP